MTEPKPADNSVPPPPAETLVQITIRRGRYVAAVLLSTALFAWVVWPTVAPPPNHGGMSLLAWPGTGGWLGVLILFAILLVSITISMALTHPDAPHTALLCAVLGMAVLTIRGGPIDPLLENALFPLRLPVTRLPEIHRQLAYESLLWLFLLALAEFFTRFLYVRFFANTAWLLRYGLPVAQCRKLVPAMLVALEAPHTEGLIDPHHKPMNPILANAGAFIVTVIIAMILLPVFMQSQFKGQTLFACLVSFGLATFCANFLFADSTSWPILLAVPLTALVGYVRSDPTFIFPAHEITAQARALPIDYLSAGTAGAILGYYSSIKLRLHNLLGEDDSAPAPKHQG